jgi:hypothetical protein
VYTVFAIFILLHPFPTTSPSQWYQTPHPRGRTCTTLLFSDFIKEKNFKWHFCMFKIATQGVCCLLYFSSFYLNAFLMVVSTSLKILYSFFIQVFLNANAGSNLRKAEQKDGRSLSS